ncbi:J domain-containing protein [Sulfurimonas sp. NWX79]|uniref:J domain-containing protein n=1 Tax=Sulfurimonas sp. NWX79 TaxID=2925412 RepID=UPI003204E006
MQILFGAHETVIKINSKSISIDYIQHYISTHFSSRKIDDNTIHIPASTTDLYHRTFLLKWLYSLYTKKNKPLPELKESLLKRYYKTIKIVLPKKIIHTIKYKIVDNETIHLSITPQNSQIALQVKTFLQTEMTILPTYLQITFNDVEEKERLKLFLASSEIIDVPHQHIYDKQKMNEFFDQTKERQKQEELISPLTDAYITLQMTPTDDIASIKKQFKKLAKRWHPDKIANDDKKLIQLHTKKFQELLESYEIILHSS